MQNYRAIFKACISDACTKLNVDFGRFARERGLQDVLIDIFGQPIYPKEIAARALEGLCHRDEQEYDLLVMAAVIEFLDRTTTTDMLQDPGGARKFADLAQAMRPGAGYREILAFLKAWYG